MRPAVASERQLRPANRSDGHCAARLTVDLERIGPTTISGPPPVEDVGGFRIARKVDEMDRAIGRSDGLGLKTRLRQSLYTHRRAGLCDGEAEQGDNGQRE